MVAHIGEDRPFGILLEVGISEGARAREVGVRVVIREACVRAFGPGRPRRGRAPPDAGDLEDAAARLPDALLLVFPVGPMILGEAPGDAIAAEHLCR